MSRNAINFHTENIAPELEHPDEIRDWILSAVKSENKTCGELNFIFCNDNYLHEINLDYLNHDTYTDIITFDYSQGNKVVGDIFISLERVAENASEFRVSVEKELHRVIIHGVLHLLGYKDKSPDEQTLMTQKEDLYLSLRGFAQ